MLALRCVAPALWYEAFAVKAGDKLCVAPESRVRLW